MEAKNLYQVRIGSYCIDLYNDNHYHVISNDSNKGMAKVYNIDLQRYEEWNAYNNCRFIELTGQTNIFND